MLLVGEWELLHEKALVQAAVGAKQADAGRHERLRRPRRGPLKSGERLERAAVANLAQRKRRIVEERPIECGDGIDRLEGIARLVVAQRLDHRPAEEVFAPPGPPCQDRLNPDIRTVRRQRADQRRPDELRLLPFERRQELRDERWIRVVLEITVGDRASWSFGLASDSCMASRVRGSLKPVSRTRARKRT